MREGTNVRYGSDNVEHDRYRYYYRHHRWRRPLLCDKEGYDKNNELVDMVTMESVPWEVVHDMLTDLSGDLDTPVLQAWKKAIGHNIVYDQVDSTSQASINYKRVLGD